MSTGVPQGCVFSPLLFSFYTSDGTAGDLSAKLKKCADNTTVISLIRDDESAYRQKVGQLTLWCGQNNLELNTVKTVDITMDFEMTPLTLPPPPAPHCTQQHLKPSGSGIHHLPGTLVDVQHWCHHEKDLVEDVIPAPVLHCSIQCYLNHPPNRTGTDYNALSGLQKKLLVPACPPSRTSTPSESERPQVTSLQTITPWTQPAPPSPLPSGRCYRTLYIKKTDTTRLSLWLTLSTSP